MKTRILHIFTRTPLHVGAGSSVGAIDQPVIRERHTQLPIVPASSLKGTFADLWTDGLLEESDNGGNSKKVRVNDKGVRTEAAWLFGSDSDKHAAAGALQFSEARLLAFPIRSARGSFVWITSPLLLRRALRDGAIPEEIAPTVDSCRIPSDDLAIFDTGNLDLDGEREGKSVKQIVLEEYTFSRTGNGEAAKLGEVFARLLPGDPVWGEIQDRLVVVSDGMMSYFAKNACEVAQHIRINDETGTADGGALFNQENVPSETMFYSVLRAFGERSAENGVPSLRNADDAFKAFAEKAANGVFQFGGDASTGLGYCTVKLDEGEGA